MGGIVSAWQFRPKTLISCFIEINKVDNFTSMINLTSLHSFLESLGRAYKIKLEHLSHSLIADKIKTSVFPSKQSFFECRCIPSGKDSIGFDDANKIKQISLLHDLISNMKNFSKFQCKSHISGSNSADWQKIFISGSESEISSVFRHLLVHDGLPNVYLGSRKITEKGWVFVSFRGVLQHVFLDRWMQGKNH